MRNLLWKEYTLAASVLSYLFLPFGLTFLLPGYPILCGVFFVSLGIFQSFQVLGETNDVLFSVLLPVSKRDVVKGKYLFVCSLEFCALAVMGGCVLLRMTWLSDASAYRENALMNANPFALGLACLIFGCFNLIFVGGFFKTAHKIGKPFVFYTVTAFLTLGVGETLHYLPSLEWLNAFGTAHLPGQVCLFFAGLLAFLLLTWYSFHRACENFEKIDL